jgi:hypothetical protein
MPDTVEIPPEGWSEFFDDLSRQQQGRIVSIEAHGEDVEPRLEVHNVPLHGVSISLDGDEEVVSIVAQEGTTSYAVHTVRAPLRIALERTPDGLAKTLHIESAHGSLTLVRFRPVVVPETIRAM